MNPLGGTGTGGFSFGGSSSSFSLGGSASATPGQSLFGSSATTNAAAPSTTIGGAAPPSAFSFGFNQQKPATTGGLFGGGAALQQPLVAAAQQQQQQPVATIGQTSQPAAAPFALNFGQSLSTPKPQQQQTLGTSTSGFGLNLGASPFGSGGTLPSATSNNSLGTLSQQPATAPPAAAQPASTLTAPALTGGFSLNFGQSTAKPTLAASTSGFGLNLGTTTFGVSAPAAATTASNPLLGALQQTTTQPTLQSAQTAAQPAAQQAAAAPTQSAQPAQTQQQPIGLGLNFGTPKPPTLGTSTSGFSLGGTTFGSTSNIAATQAKPLGTSTFPSTTFGLQPAQAAGATTTAPAATTTSAAAAAVAAAPATATAPVAAQATPATATTAATIGTAPATAAAAAPATTTTTAPASVTAAPAVQTNTPATSAVAATATTASGATASSNSAITFRVLEDYINKWMGDLDVQEKDFLNQATQLNALDKLMVDNGEKIIDISNEVNRLNSEQEQLEQELNFIYSQQSDLEQAIQKLESGVESMPIVTQQASDTNRIEMYRTLIEVDNQLKSTSIDLRDIIKRLNDTNVNLNDPIVQISKILNAHMDSLNWIEENASLVQDQVSKLSKVVEDNVRDNDNSKFLFL